MSRLNSILGRLFSSQYHSFCVTFCPPNVFCRSSVPGFIVCSLIFELITRITCTSQKNFLPPVLENYHFLSTQLVHERIL